MKKHWASIPTIVSMLLVICPLSSAQAQALSTKELRRAQKTAQKAAAAGQVEQAVELFEKVLASVPAGDPRRAAALYTVALAHLAPGAEPEAFATARAHLDELAKLPGPNWRLETAALRNLLAQLDRATAETARRAAEFEQKLAASEAQREETRASIADESEAVDEQVKDLEAQLRRARADLRDTRAELENKEEALQKLKDALVGGAGGSG